VVNLARIRVRIYSSKLVRGARRVLWFSLDVGKP
jgi:hypothetical protein